MEQAGTQDVNKRKYFASLDLLKFVCALLIVVHHYQMVFNLWFEGRLNFNNGYFYFGFLVELFFMVSGFLMENSIQGHPYSDFGTMFKNKYLRFFPMCFISISVYTFFQWVGALLTGEFFNNGQVISFWNYLMSALLVSKGWGINIYRPANSSIWYIDVLLICYIWHFILNKLSAKLNISVIYFYFAMVILGLNLHNKEIPYGFLDNDCAVGYITTFLGMILYRLIRDYREVMRKVAYVVLIVTAIIAVVLVKKDFWSTFRESQQYFLIFILYPPVLTILSTSNTLNIDSIQPVSKYLGKLSFEMYIWHFPLLILMNIILAVSGYPIVHGYKSMTVFEVIVVVVAMFMCRFVEPVANSFADKIKARL